MAIDPARFKRDGDQVTLAGIVEVPPANQGDDLGIVVFTLPEGYRPAEEGHFRVTTERGSSIVTVAPDGSVLADPRDGWISLNGITFTAAG